VLPFISKLEELKLERIDDLSLQSRNWMDELGRPMYRSTAAAEDATAEEETKEESSTTPIAAMEGAEDKETAATAAASSTPSSSSSAAAAAGASSSSAPSSPAASLFALLSQCRSLRLLRWASTESVLQSSADYTGLCSWDRTRPTVAEQKRRLLKEQARDRQVLRKLAQMKKDERSAAAVAAVASSADVAADPLVAAASFDLDANDAPVDYLTSTDAQQAAFDAAILDEERDIEIDAKARVEAERQAQAEKASKKKPKGAAKKK
jgi:hypothetical protein